MNTLSVAILIASALVCGRVLAQRSPIRRTAFQVAPIQMVDPNLPAEPIGASDLIRLTVSDSPELSHSFRVDSQGMLSLPLLRVPISAKDLLPDALGNQIAMELRTEHLLVNPIVVVSVAKYASRGVSVVGAVTRPVTAVPESGMERRSPLRFA